MYNLWVARWRGNDSLGGKINRIPQVEAELDIAIGGKGGEWGAISIAQWWVEMKGNFTPHVLVRPIAIWEILTAWNQGIQPQMQKLGIGPTGNAGLGTPAINALWEAL